MANHTLAASPQWKQFAGVVQEALRSLSLFQTHVQWLVVEHDGAHGRVLLCSGAGPFSTSSVLSGCLAEMPVSHAGGTLCGTPLPGDHRDLWLGLWLDQAHGEPRAADLALVRAKAALVAALLGEARARERLMTELEASRRDAETDVLTGLYNRRGWQRVLAREQARCERYGSPCTLMVLDLDALKAVNDRDGHVAGDDLIRRAARVLTETIRQPDVVARIGGDEFAVLLTETGALNAAAFLRRLRVALMEARVGASIGWAERHPAENLEDTLGRADADMYSEKRERVAPA